MAKKFRPLCTIAFRHNYFNRNGGVCRDFDLTPMPSAIKLFKQFDLRLQEDSAGYKLWFGQETPRRALIFTARAQLRLSFLLRLRTPYFFNYTRLPFVDLNAHLYYFNNLDLSKEDPVQLLNRGPFVGLNDDEMAPKTSIKFTDPAQSADRSAFAAPSPPKPALEFQDPAPPEGRGVFGILDIFIGENGLEIEGFGEDSLVPARYELHFQARETFWRYFVFNPKNLEITGLNINSGNGNQFENLGEQNLQGGQKAFRLESSKSIQLEEFSRHIFMLKVSNEVNGIVQNAEINLPSPDIRMIKPEVNPASNDRKVYSDMYVYL